MLKFEDENNYMYPILLDRRMYYVSIFVLFCSRCRPLMFYVFNWLFCIVSLAGVFIWYHFYTAHCIFLGVMSTVLIMNGGNYYIDVFSKRGFVEDECE